MGFWDTLGKGLNYAAKKGEEMQNVRNQMECYDDETLFDYVHRRRGGTQLQRMMAAQILKDRGYGEQ
ncbi:hypothetical protein FZ041_11080 [Selenomonas caprae]|uniref:Uncharacterized protein n=1 Tax=Selenomonas caprae TaxID=2606905 RepID=A0A5D6WKE5_9FIRM|nr:hypothetical protein [Selenomonas caprae]TYZ27539.1 hypothetical protein FZ041_11080 [Selenomonas caprae]